MQAGQSVECPAATAATTATTPATTPTTAFATTAPTAGAFAGTPPWAQWHATAASPA